VAEATLEKIKKEAEEEEEEKPTEGVLDLFSKWVKEKIEGSKKKYLAEVE